MTILRAPVARVFKPLLKKRRFRGAKGGRGSGKSHFFAEELVLDTIAEHTRAVCAREVQNSIKDSSKQLIEDKIHKFGLESYFKITDREIICPSTDSLMIFRGLQSHTVATIKSLEGFNRLLVGEAQTISYRSLELAIPTFRKGSVLDFDWNPYSKKDAVEQLFNENIGDPDFCLVHANYSDNPWFPEELRRDMERDKKRDPGKYAHVWLGAYQNMSEARVFKNWEVRDFTTPKDARFFLGADWGFSVDPTVLIRMFIGRWDEHGNAVNDPKGLTLFIDAEAYQIGCEIEQTPTLFDKLDPLRPRMARDWPLVADNARPETISYMKRHGYTRIKPSIKGAGSVEDGIEFMQNYDIVIHSNCKHTIDEFATYSYKIDPRTGEILPVLADKDNHVIDAARYALEGTRRSTYTLANVG